MARWLILTVLACACSSKQTPGVGPGSGDGERPPVGMATSCDELRPKLEELYRAEARVKEPKRVDEATADNTAMVLADCAKSPDTVIACVNAAVTVAEIESRCIRPLDEEGSEGLELR
jgi:hypothetical protein